jgi:hypothetical protein
LRAHVGDIGLEAVVHSQIGGLALAQLAQAIQFAFADEIILALLILTRLDLGEAFVLLHRLFVRE